MPWSAINRWNYVPGSECAKPTRADRAAARTPRAQPQGITTRDAGEVSILAQLEDVEQQARAALARGDCGEYQRIRNQLSDNAKSTLYSGFTRRAGEILASLPADCPSAATNFKIGASVSALDGVDVSNGGLGGKRTAIMLGTDVQIEVRGKFQLRAWGAGADTTSGPIFIAPTMDDRIFLQPNGGTQVVPGFLPGTVKTDANLLQAGFMLDVMMSRNVVPLMPSPLINGLRLGRRIGASATSTSGRAQT